MGTLGMSINQQTTKNQHFLLDIYAYFMHIDAHENNSEHR